jgi:glycosyltransferase involved in cell wall biosynthesis
MNKVRQSMLFPACVEARVIPNGVDLSVFQPTAQELARAELDLPMDANVLLFAANSIGDNPWKDFVTIRDALARIAAASVARRLVFVALGEDAPAEKIGQAELLFIPFQRDPTHVARYYHAADVYVHAAKVDTFPTTILEALACGRPVVATAVGGIPEQVQNEETGFLIPAGDSMLLADRIALLLDDKGLRTRMGRRAASSARRHFDLNRQADEYLTWYREILACYHASGDRTVKEVEPS